MGKFSREIMVDCSPGEAFDFLQDADHFRLMPGIREVTREGEVFLIKGEEKLPFIGLDIVSYRICIDEKKPSLLRYHTEEFMLDEHGSWELTEVDGKTRINYELEYKIPGSFLGHMVDRVLVKKKLGREIEEYLDNLRKFLVKVEDVMSKDVISAESKTPISQVTAKMDETGVRYLPVTEDGKLVGVVTDGDILARMYAQGWNFGERLVEEIMTREVKTITPETSLFRAVKLLATHKIRRLPVVKETGEVVGVISATDLEVQLGMFKKRKPRPSRIWGEVEI